VAASNDDEREVLDVERSRSRRPWPAMPDGRGGADEADEDELGDGGGFVVHVGPLDAMPDGRGGGGGTTDEVATTSEVRDEGGVEPSLVSWRWTRSTRRAW
jgi:hypothetical protein